MRTSYVEKSLWFLAGASIGVGATFLFGTRAGQRLQRQIRRSAEDYRESLVERGKEVLEKGKKVLAETREMVGSGLRAVRRVS